jgi:uncharacterized membrane protein YfcA
LDPQSLSWFVLGAAGAVFLLAGFMHGLLGLGFPMLATPLLAVMMDIRSAVLLTLLPTVTVNLISIYRGGRWAESIGRYWPLAVMIPLGALGGTWLLVRIDPAPFRLLLAVVILLHLASGRIRGAHLAWVKTHTWLAYLLFGLAAGFLAGTVNVMVPLLIIFALQVGMAPVAMVQVFNLCFLAGKTAQIGALAHAGLFTWTLAAATLPMAAAAAGTLLLGMRVRERVDADTYRGWLRRVLLVIALTLVVQFAVGM